MSTRFILQPGRWEGEGTITFSMAEDKLTFKMQWSVSPIEEEKILFRQQIQVNGFNEPMQNNFCMSEITEENFQIELENNIVGKVYGKGIISQNVIAWEFRRSDQDFEGFEIYELQPDGSYHMKAEFTAGEGLRTFVQGYIKNI